MCISFFKRFACCRGRSMAGKSSHIHHREYAATSGSCGVFLKYFREKSKRVWKYAICFLYLCFEIS